MTIIYAAATAPVNPPGVSPVLSLKQLWAGLEMKVRYVIILKTGFIICISLSLSAQTQVIVVQDAEFPSKPKLFLAVIDTCEVLEDDGETVLREVKFKDGNCSLIFLSS